MLLDVSDFLTDHRFIILIDILGYSELSDDQQLQVIHRISAESKCFIRDGGYQNQRVFSAFIPTGDGFYMVGHETMSLFWGQMCIIFAISLRNILHKRFRELGLTCNGVRTAVHYGTTRTFIDIAGHENFVGSGMNETPRLLSPINKQEVSAISQKFYGHENSVIVSNLALNKLHELPKAGFRLSDEFYIQAKHDRSFACKFIDLPPGRVYNVISLA